MRLAEMALGLIGRPPTADEMRRWRRHLARGGRFRAVTGSLLRSPECVLDILPGGPDPEAKPLGAEEADE